MRQSIERMIRHINAITFPVIIVYLFGIFYLSCSNQSSPTSAGNGSGTGVGNGVVIGMVTDSASIPVFDAHVKIRTVQYLADTSENTGIAQNDTTLAVNTDINGMFIFDSVKTGRSYCIEVIKQGNQASHGTRYLCKIDSTGVSDTVKLQPRILLPVKRILGKVVLSGQPRDAHVQIYGLERAVKTDSLGEFTIVNLPVGTLEEGVCKYKLKVIVMNNKNNIKAFDYDLEIKANSDNDIRLEIECEKHSPNPINKKTIHSF